MLTANHVVVQCSLEFLIVRRLEIAQKNSDRNFVGNRLFTNSLFHQIRFLDTNGAHITELDIQLMRRVSGIIIMFLSFLVFPRRAT